MRVAGLVRAFRHHRLVLLIAEVVVTVITIVAIALILIFVLGDFFSFPTHPIRDRGQLNLHTINRNDGDACLKKVFLVVAVLILQQEKLLLLYILLVVSPRLTTTWDSNPRSGVLRI